MHATRQVLVVKEVIGVARRNTTLKNLIQYKDATVEKIPLIPDDMAHISESTFVPTGGLRTSGRQASARHTTFAGLSVLSSSKRRSITWMMARGESFWRAKFSVTTTRFLQKFTSTIQARTSSIYEYIRDNSEHRDTMTDVRTWSLACVAPAQKMSDDDAVAETIVNFNMESPQNVSSVYQSARGNTGVISITTGHMRSMLGSFPEILQMDCTHKKNK
ncbi:hypothetical protein L917_14698 [Phytophthora nicotianae]|uniref:ZSWIM1/3 RNaseH-like domain-containing protein n=1 Tax=Phytophthora nicotianae TaxID=4792 RepID=W2KN74_PHYNI|nr:hypothetical protein L917_14698 [Phytophthora nicotianae]